LSGKRLSGKVIVRETSVKPSEYTTPYVLHGIRRVECKTQRPKTRSRPKKADCGAKPSPHQPTKVLEVLETLQSGHKLCQTTEDWSEFNNIFKIMIAQVYFR